MQPGRVFCVTNLSMAGSMISGLFVAAMTNTNLLSSSPSISVSSWLTTRSDTLLPSLVPEPRFGTSASNSSKKMTQGAEARARWNTLRTARSDWPTYWFNNSGPLIDRKLAPLSFAIAFATRVLPAGEERTSERRKGQASDGKDTQQ
jgi:hypothetical protein